MKNYFQKQKLSFIVFLFLMVSYASFFAQTRSIEKHLHSNWEFQKKGSKKWYNATVPGSIHTDLMNNGIIEDPYYRLNETKVQWVDKEDWVYQNTFNISKKEYQKQHHEIQFEGLDTYASVYLNDSLILQSNNMHRTYIVNVKSQIKQGENSLKIILESPIRRGLELYNSLNYKIPVSANDQAEVGQVEGNKRISVFTRKAGYHYGWDWGPRLVTSGIWRPVTLHSWDDVRIKDFNISYSFDGPTFIKTDLLIESSVNNKNASLLIFVNDSIVVSKDIRLTKGEQNLIQHFSLNNTKLWWPNGMGEQNLYDFKAEIRFNNHIRILDQKIGFKAIYLQEKDATQSPNFYFNVNGYPTFAKGVNYIPQDIFLNRVKSSNYETLLVAAANANMNMIRVWGGGIYEDDRFYELCDSLGLMVWQDFMFACAMYPGDSSFLENVRLEATDNYNRLKKYTCIALWCGNNENLAAWKRWGWENTAIKDQSKRVADKIWHHYDTLFHQILPKVVYENHPEHGFSRNNDWPDYWSSSPSAKEGVPESYKIGDTHYWGVWWGKEPFGNYNTKISSFMSEYGFQSFPEYQTFKQFGKKKDEDMYSKVMKYHQRSSIGNNTIEEYMGREYQDPKDFKSLLYLSQILQSDGIRTAIEAHRRNKDQCMGSLYWQLNDCWPGASWSSIDYYGKWKALHYNIKKAFNPVIISHEFKDSNLHVFVVSDLKESLECEMEIKLMRFKSEIPIKKWNQKIKINPFKSLTVKSLAIEEFNVDKNDNYVQLILKNNGNIISSKNIFFFPIKELNLPKPNLTYQVNVDSSLNKLHIDIKTNYFAKGVYVASSSKLNFTENYFDLDANEEKRVSIDLLRSENIDQLIESIKLNSIWNSTH
tara:strand:- start:68 stop:2692 length:2625 start_codon:yes stop_codon:yes gene_type:complete